MMANILSRVPENVVKEMEIHAFVLFKDLNFKKFTNKIVENIEFLPGYKTEEDYDDIAKESAETSKYSSPKLKRVYGELVKRNLQTFDIKFEEYITSLPRSLSEELKKDKEVMSMLNGLRVPDRGGLLEERYIRYLLGQLAITITITALKMTKSGKMLIQKEQEGESYPSKAFYAEKNFLSMHYLNEKSDELMQYNENCSKITITKDDVIRLGNKLSVFSPHKIGWLD